MVCNYTKYDVQLYDFLFFSFSLNTRFKDDIQMMNNYTGIILWHKWLFIFLLLSILQK